MPHGQILTTRHEPSFKAKCRQRSACAVLLACAVNLSYASDDGDQYIDSWHQRLNPSWHGGPNARTLRPKKLPTLSWGAAKTNKLRLDLYEHRAQLSYRLPKGQFSWHWHAGYMHEFDQRHFDQLQHLQFSWTGNAYRYQGLRVAFKPRHLEAISFRGGVTANQHFFWRSVLGYAQSQTPTYQTESHQRQMALAEGRLTLADISRLRAIGVSSWYTTSDIRDRTNNANGEDKRLRQWQVKSYWVLSPYWHSDLSWRNRVERRADGDKREVLQTAQFALHTSTPVGWSAHYTLEGTNGEDVWKQGIKLSRKPLNISYQLRHADRKQWKIKLSLSSWPIRWQTTTSRKPLPTKAWIPQNKKSLAKHTHDLPKALYLR